MLDAIASSVWRYVQSAVASEPAVQEVDHGAGPAQEPAGGLDDGLQDLFAVVHRADLRHDLAQRPFGLGRAREGRSRRRQLLDQAGVGDGDGRLAAKCPDQGRVLVVERVGQDGVDLDDAERAVVAGDRARRSSSGSPSARRTRSISGLGGNWRRQVVAGDDDPVLGDGGTGRADADRDPQLRPLLRAEAAARRRRRTPSEGARSPRRGCRGWRPGRRRAGSPARRPAGGSRPGRACAVMRAAISRSACSASARRASALRDRSSASSRRVRAIAMAACAAIASSNPASASPHASRAAREGREGAERPALADEGRGHHRVDAGRFDVAVGAPAVREAIVVGVVAGPERTRVDHRLAGDALLERLVGIIGPHVIVGLDGARGVRPAQQARSRIDEVDARAIGVQQARRLVHRQLEDAREVGGRRDTGVDLAERPLDFGPLGELGA